MSSERNSKVGVYDPNTNIAQLDLEQPHRITFTARGGESEDNLANK